MSFSYRLFSILLIALLFSTSSFSQSVIQGQRVDNDSYDELYDKFEYFDLFKLDAEKVNQAVTSPAENNLVHLDLGDYEWQMELHPNSIYTNDMTATVFENGESKEGVLPKVISYLGQLKGVASSRINITITPNMILGIVDDGKSKMFIEKLSNVIENAPSDVYIVYNTNSVIDNPHIGCGIDEVNKKAYEFEGNGDQPEGAESSACYEAVVGLATDAGMAARHGGPTGAQSHAIGILTLVQLNYDDEFTHEIMFIIGAHFNASGTNPAAWNFGSINSLLVTFKSWGNGGGFGTTAYDVATLWTTQNYGGTIGLAYVKVICGGSRYNVCVDYTTNSNGLRNLQAHELGHNFGLTHDGSGSPHIMAPAVNGSNTWSGMSKSQMNGNIPFPCMGACIGITPPIPDFTANPEEGCVPMVVNFIDQSTNNPQQWLWTFPGGIPGNSTQQNPVVSYPTPGRYDVTLEVSNTGGSNVEIKRFFIDVGDVPIPNFDANVVLDEVIFQDESIVYGTANYIWDFGDGNFSNDRNPTHEYELDGTYIVTLTIQTLCGTRTIQKSVTVVTPPIAQFYADTTNMCVGTSITFTNESSYNSESFKWKFEGGSPETSTEENPTVYYDSAGVFTVELLAINTRYQDVEKKSGYIVVDSMGIAEFVADVDLDLLEVEFTTETPNARTYDWDFGDGNSSNQRNPDHTYAKDSTYEVTLVISNYCGDDTMTQQLVVGRLPQAGFTADMTNGCLPQDVTFEDTSSANTTRRIWTFEGGSPAMSTESNPVVTYDTEGEYKVTLIAINGLGNDTLVEEKYITIEDSPLSDFDFTRNGYEIDFNNLSENGTSFNWDFGDGNMSTDENPTHTYNGDGEYNVILVVSNGCGMDTVEQTVRISNQPNANFTADRFVGCVPLQVQLENLSSTNTESVEWLIPGANPAMSTEDNPTIEFNNPGVYRVRLIAKNAFGNDTIEKRDFIEVLDVPVAGFDHALNGFDVDFTADATYGKTYAWDFGDGNTSTEENPTHTFMDEGVYRVILIVSNICGDDTIEKDINVTPKPIVDFTSSVTEVCVGDTVEFMDVSANNPTAWLWTFENGDPGTSTDQNPKVVYKSAGKYQVQLEATNQFGTNESIVSEYITVYDDPVAAYDVETRGIRANFTNMSQQIGTHEWDFGDGETSDEVDPSHLYKRPGTYTVTLTVDNACGTDVFTQEVTVRYNGIDIFNGGAPPSPNPTPGVVTVEYVGQPADVITINVVGLDGQYSEVFKGDFTSGQMKETLDLSFLNEGSYFLFFQTKNDVSMTKVIIQK